MIRSNEIQFVQNKKKMKIILLIRLMKENHTVKN